MFALFLPTMTFGQERTQIDDQVGFPRHYLGSSLFSLFNFAEDSGDYYLLTYGYRLSQKDVIIVEANTWKYSEPLGTYGVSEEGYPGKIRAWGIGGGYQRFHWRNLYTTVQATVFLQQFYAVDDVKIQKGFQLYCQLIAGYRFEFHNERFYLEPAWALKYWPVDTNFPDSFDEIREGTPNHTFEPSLYFGVNF